jgi:hypothetical protein
MFTARYRRRPHPAHHIQQGDDQEQPAAEHKR